MQTHHQLSQCPKSPSELICVDWIVCVFVCRGCGLERQEGPHHRRQTPSIEFPIGGSKMSKLTDCELLVVACCCCVAAAAAAASSQVGQPAPQPIWAHRGRPTPSESRPAMANNNKTVDIVRNRTIILNLFGCIKFQTIGTSSF